MAFNLRRFLRRDRKPNVAGDLLENPLDSVGERARHPDTLIKPRTGDARHVPVMATYGHSRGGVVVQQVNRLDDVSVRDLDRARVYPIVKDSLATLLVPLLRAEKSFKCDRQEIADLAMQMIGPHIRGMTRALVKPSKEFGWGAIWPRWIPQFDISVSLGQSPSGGKVERYYPFVWALEGFYSFSPHDTRILIDTRTGRFGGIRQLTTPRFPNQRDILARECMHFVNDREFDGNYGVAAIKPVVPFVEAVVSVFSSMVLASDKFADPIKTMYYPSGVTPMGSDPATGRPMKVRNIDLAMSIADAAQGGSTQCLPSNPYVGTNVRQWELTFQDPGTGTDPYTPRIELLNDMIRIGIAVPQIAGSDTVEGGAYNQGVAIIDLLLDNLQSDLNEVENVVNTQLLPLFVLYNFGADAPPCYLKFRPLDFETAKMVFKMLMDKIQSGEPIAETKDGIVMADTAKYAEDAGLATITVPRSEAQVIANSVADQIRNALKDQGAGRSDQAQEEEKAKLSDRRKKLIEPADFLTVEPMRGPGWVPATEAENIANGQHAITRARTNRADELHVMHRPEIGHISFLYGDAGDAAKQYKDGWGVAHIEARRGLVKKDADLVLNALPEILAKGTLRSTSTRGGTRQRFNFEHNGYEAVVAPHFAGDPQVKWVVTSFEKVGP